LVVKAAILAAQDLSDNQTAAESGVARAARIGIGSADRFRLLFHIEDTYATFAGA
jgi:hypothetical protein